MNPSSSISHCFAIRHSIAELGVLKQIENPSQPVDVIWGLLLMHNCFNVLFIAKAFPNRMAPLSSIEVQLRSIFSNKHVGWDRIDAMVLLSESPRRALLSRMRVRKWLCPINASPRMGIQSSLRNSVSPRSSTWTFDAGSPSKVANAAHPSIQGSYIGR